MGIERRVIMICNQNLRVAIADKSKQDKGMTVDAWFCECKRPHHEYQITEINKEAGRCKSRKGIWWRGGGRGED